jgi:hypothetical protein
MGPANYRNLTFPAARVSMGQRERQPKAMLGNRVAANESKTQNSYLITRWWLHFARAWRTVGDQSNYELTHST